MLKEYIMTTDEELQTARNRFFPGWWTCLRKHSPLAPFYRVVCGTLKEYNLARKAKPDGIDADIIYKPKGSLEKKKGWEK